MNKIEEEIKDKALWKYDNSKFHVQTSESGLHSDLYLNTDYVMAEVVLLEEIVEKVFLKELNSRKIKPDWIITYPPFGLAIAYSLARQTGAKFGYVDSKAEVCNFDIKEGDSVIVVGDEIYTGGCIKKTIDIVDKLGAKIEPTIFIIGNFSGAKTLGGFEVVSVLSENGNFYEEKDCPMCKAGSKAVLPRPNWPQLMEK